MVLSSPLVMRAQGPCIRSERQLSVRGVLLPHGAVGTPVPTHPRTHDAPLTHSFQIGQSERNQQHTKDDS